MEACKFCGQVSTEKECNCTGAVIDRQVQRGLEKVAMLFGEKCEETGFKKVADEQIEILNESVKKVAYDEILSVAFQLGSGVRAKISKNSKGQVVVDRADTKAYKLTT
jgi:hypothetical protein